MGLPKIEMLSTKRFTEYKFCGGSWFPCVLSATILASIFLPYFIVVIRGTLNPFLPYISQVIGSPPQSGVFTVLITLAALFAFVGLNLLHMGIRTQKARLKDDWVRHLTSLLSNVSLIPGHVAIIGMIIVGSYPIDFYRSSPEWVKITIIPHVIGALSVFFGGIFYCMIITYVLSLIHPEQKQILGIRIFLVCLITMCSALQGITAKGGFWPPDFDYTLNSCLLDMDTLPPYNLRYLISSVSEWSLIIFFAVFFLTLKDEVKDFSFTMSVAVEGDIKGEISEQPKTDENSNLGKPENEEKKS